jgi:hypothetical protein
VIADENGAPDQQLPPSRDGADRAVARGGPRNGLRQAAGRRQDAEASDNSFDVAPGGGGELDSDTEDPDVEPSRAAATGRRDNDGPDNGGSADRRRGQAAAQDVAAQPRRAANRKRIVFDDSDYSDAEYDGDREGASPRHKQAAPKRFKGPRSRDFFTVEEVEAIKEGVRRWGVGKWAEIKKHSQGRLDNRTSVQIKDKYRNLVRTNQI